MNKLKKLYDYVSNLHYTYINKKEYYMGLKHKSNCSFLAKVKQSDHVAVKQHIIDLQKSITKECLRCIK